MPISRECDIDPGFDPLTLAKPSVEVRPKPALPLARLTDLFLDRLASNGHCSREDVEAAGFTEAEIHRHRRAAASRAARRETGGHARCP